VAVRLLLDEDYSGGSVNKSAYDGLKAAGVPVRWALPSVIFHQKTITVDATTSLVGTANLTAQYYKTSRDAWIYDRDPQAVAAIEATFDSDWKGTAGPPAGVAGPALVWSPGAEATMVNALTAAQHSVSFESEELSDPAVIAALVTDAQRGVVCEVTMTDSSSWSSAFAAVTAAGCQVHTYPDTPTALYIHEKIVLTDAGQPDAGLLIGSQNASVSSLDYNRELSVQLTEALAGPVIDSVAQAFAKDFAGAPPWSP
jgi:cardiolipin synthase A/B